MKTIVTLLIIGCATAAMAQSNADDRMDRLERDLQLIQKQIANAPADAEGASLPPQVGNARLGAQLSAIQEDLRKIHGQLEQMDHANKRNADAIERLQKDSDLRFTDIEKKLHESTAAAPTPAAAPVATTPVAEAPATPAAPAPAASAASSAAPEKPASKPMIKVEDAPAAPKEEAPKAAPKTFEVARDHYNYAFRLLNQSKYDEAAEYFQSFTKAFAKDPLIGNAYYWLGETYYIKRDYVKAADNFREGFESLPNGPKAADNLLKLAMSLSALKRTDDACVVLKQVTTKFANSSSVLLKKAEDEKVRMGCK